MQLQFKSSPDKNSVILVPLFAETELPDFLPEQLISFIQKRHQTKEFNFEVGENLKFYDDESKNSDKYLVFGLGKPEKASSSTLRNQFAQIIKVSREHTKGVVSIYLPDKALDFAQSLGEALELGNYFFQKYKTGEDRKKLEEKFIKKLTVFGNIDKKSQSLLEKGLVIGESVNMVRDLVNGPCNTVNVDYMADLAKKIAKDNSYKITILDKEKLTKLKMGALLGVNQGSSKGAKLVVMEYLPMKKKEAPIALIGKGIVFDTGGYNLKPSQYMDGMNMDMAGAAVVIGVFQLLAELKIKRNVIGAFPLTDNLVSSTSQLPNDIVTSFSGKTIEIGNTDAEGRLVLADTISYIIKAHNPSAIIDLATLTGACRAALGERYAGLLGNNNELKQSIKMAAKETDEAVWTLPIHEDHKKAMKSKLADLINIDNTGLAGASTGAAFIGEFVENKPWAHLDIAGVASVKAPKEYDFQGGTGFGVRLLIKLLENN